MGLANVEQRFSKLLAEPGTLAHDVHAVLAEAAAKINGMVEGQHPVLFSIIQHLEMAAHLTVSSPHLAVAQSAANPTEAAPATDAATSTEVATSTEPNSTPNSDSSATSSSKGSAR